jgi:ABC-type cobalamin/Fe3+-siderophores transport system ATPase subunit
MPPEPAIAAPAPLLEARALTKRFDALLALDAVSLAVAPGTVTAILGPSGSGKSTLLRCLNFLVQPDTGEILFNGDVIDARHVHAIGQRPAGPGRNRPKGRQQDHRRRKRDASGTKQKPPGQRLAPLDLVHDSAPMGCVQCVRRRGWGGAGGV